MFLGGSGHLFTANTCRQPSGDRYKMSHQSFGLELHSEWRTWHERVKNCILFTWDGLQKLESQVSTGKISKNILYFHLKKPSWKITFGGYGRIYFNVKCFGCWWDGLFFGSSARWHFDKSQIAQCLKRHIMTVFITRWYKGAHEEVLQITLGLVGDGAHGVTKNQCELSYTCAHSFLIHLNFFLQSLNWIWSESYCL